MYATSEVVRRETASMASVSMSLDTMLTLDARTATPKHSMNARDLRPRLDAVRPLIAQGWAEGAQQASALSTVLAGEIPAVASIRQRWEYGPEGDDLVAERALAGDWDVAYRRRVKRVTAGHRIVTLAAAMGGTAGISSQQMFWTGAQLAAACDVLESAGYRVEAHAINISAFYPGHHGAADIVCKLPDEPLRPDLIMAVAAYADTFRSFGFLAKCHYPERFSMSGFGRTLERESEREPILRQMETDGLLPVIDNWMPHAYNRDTAVRNVLNVLNAITGEVAHV